MPPACETKALRTFKFEQYTTQNLEYRFKYAEHKRLKKNSRISKKSRTTSQLTFTCSNSTVEALEKRKKYVQS